MTALNTVWAAFAAECGVSTPAGDDACTSSPAAPSFIATPDAWDTPTICSADPEFTHDETRRVRDEVLAEISAEVRQSCDKEMAEAIMTAVTVASYRIVQRLPLNMSRVAEVAS